MLEGEQAAVSITARPMKVEWHPALSIYASEVFLKLVGDEYGWLGGIDDRGSLRCILPYTIIKKPGFRIARFRMETIPSDGVFSLQEEKAFLNGVVDYFHELGADIIIPPSTNSIFRTYPDGAIAAPYASYIVDLTQSEQALWNNLNAKCRNRIRRSIRNEIEIRSGSEDVRLCYDIIRKTLKLSGLGFMTCKEFERLVFGLGENVKVFKAYHHGVLQACTVFPFSAYGAYSLYAGKIANAETGAMNLLNWEAMKQFQQLGVNRFDFVGVRINPDKGSKQAGLKTFKESFGGDLIQGYLWKYSFRPLKFAVYSAAVRLLRGGDIIDQEQHHMA